ncbi:MAG TPA: hypothetical protein VGL41_00660 [Roseiarcus sp.]|jgi:hypothetical protein
MKPLAPIFLAALLFPACNAAAQPPQIDAFAAGSLMLAQQDAQLPEGGSCAGDIARYRAVQEQDIKMGHVAKSVYNKIKGEIAAAEVECNNGHEAHARQMILVSKKKHGYPTDL